MNSNITSALQKEPNGTIRLTITIPYSDVKKTWEEVMSDVVKNAEIQGFRGLVAAAFKNATNYAIKFQTIKHVASR